MGERPEFSNGFPREMELELRVLKVIELPTKKRRKQPLGLEPLIPNAIGSPWCQLGEKRAWRPESPGRRRGQSPKELSQGGDPHTEGPKGARKHLRGGLSLNAGLGGGGGCR